MAYQHLTQRAYLKKWGVPSGGGPPHLYTLRKSTGHSERHPIPKKRDLHILGMENVQTEEMERAFADVEEKVGIFSCNQPLQDHEKTSLMRWIALHGVRCAKFAEMGHLKGRDYRDDVKSLSNCLASYAAFVVSANRAVYMTCDNPCLYLSIRETGILVWAMALSPFKYIVFTPHGKAGVMPYWDFNQAIREAASNLCVSSFDSFEHLTSPPSNYTKGDTSEWLG